MMVSLESSLGIQFGEDHLLLVYLKKFLKEVVIDCHELIPLPPDIPGEEVETFWVRELSRFIKQNNIGKENVWVSLPQKEFVLRFITLPASAEENLREVVRYEMEKYFPFSAEDINFDFVVLERDDNTKNMRLLLVVIKKKVLETYLSILHGAGITPSGIEMPSSALLNFFISGNPESDTTPTVLATINKNGCELTWISKKTLRYSRAIEFANQENLDRIQQITAEIQNGFRVTFPSQMWSAGVDTENYPVIYLTGKGLENDLINGLFKTEEMHFAILPVETISSRLHLANSCSQELTGGIGVALKGIQSVPWDINLLPQPLRKKTRKAGIYLSLFLVVLVLVLTITWGVSTVVKERLELRKVEREIAGLEDEVIAIQKLQKQAETICRKVEGLGNIQKSEFSKLETLKELSTILPPSVWLTNFRYYKKELDLAGYAASASDLIAILGGSPLFYASEFTAPITRDRGGNENFKIKTKIESK
ncbi:MAG: pilus assembly protein PilM [Pseudomonadota bacterium]